MIDISNMGESALKSHMKSKRHKNNGTIGGEQAVTLSSFGFVSCGNGNSGEAGKAGTSQSQQQAVMTIPRRLKMMQLKDHTNNFGRTCD